MNILHGHISPETAYVVADYPYGFRLRCKMRYWLEYKPTHGVRVMSQTSNPKKPGLVWNKPKAGIYSRFGAALWLDEEGRVTHSGLSEYTDGAEAQKWLDTYGVGLPDECAVLTRKWVAAKVAYDANRTKDDPLHVGLVEARKAFIKG